MPLPAPLQAVTVRGLAVDVVGNPAQPGTVTLTPLAPAMSPAGQVLITTGSISVDIQSDGTIADIEGVLLTDSPGLSNRVPYLLEISAPGFRQQRIVELLANQVVAGVIRLETIATATPPPALVSYLLAAAMGEPGGPAGPLDGSGQLPDEQLPPGSGGSAPVLSVDGRTGEVTLADRYAALVHAHTTGQVTDFATAVDARIQNVVGAAPVALDTLVELAAALGNDANFAATVTTALGARALAARLISAGTGLSGGGDLTVDRALAVVYGASAGTAAQGNDSRLSDARTPLAHGHVIADTTGLQTALDGKQPLDADLTAMAAMSPADGSVLARVAGAWGSRTTAELKADLAIAFADISGTVPNAALPPLAINETFVVGSEAAMLALTAQRGDIAIRTDSGRTYVLSSDAPGTLADWKEVLAAGQVQSVASKTGVVTLVKGDVGLSNVDNTSDASKPISTATQAALDGKAPLAHGHALERVFAAYGGRSGTGHPLSFEGAATPGGTDHLIALVPVVPGETITAVLVANGAAATFSATATPSQCRMYDFDGALLGTSPNDDALWGTVGMRWCTFAVPFVAPANGLCFVGFSFGGYSGVSLPSSPGINSAILAGLAGGKRLGIFANDGAGLPSSFNPATYGIGPTDWIPYVVVVSS